MKEGYPWLLQGQTQQTPWARLIRNRTSVPRHSFTAWLMLPQRLPVLHRLGRFTQMQSQDCILCHISIEKDEHLFFAYCFARDIWKKVLGNWGIRLKAEGLDQYITSLKQMQQARSVKSLICTTANAVIYNIWPTRNLLMFKARLQHPT